MIETLTDLLEQLRDRELQLMAQYHVVKHGPMIGDMYEGLTRKLVRTASTELLAGLDLRVVQGMIRDPAGQLSRQLDCMLVTGSGEAIPNTPHHIYASGQVIAVIEVKTNLYSADLQDAYENLRSVHDTGEPRDMSVTEATHAFRSIARLDLPDAATAERLPYDLQMLRHALIVDAMLPVRIVLGYFGFKSEWSLRERFAKYLEANVTAENHRPIHGFGPTSFPNLILCNNNALVKTNGMPFAFPRTPEGKWVAVSSYEGGGTRLLLEAIWSRLSYRFQLGAALFGQDLEIEALRPLVMAQAIRVGGTGGWHLTIEHWTRDELRSAPIIRVWEPVELSEAEFHAITLLCSRGELAHDGPELQAIAVRVGIAQDQFVTALLQTGLVGRDEDGPLYLLTELCRTLALADGRFLAGEDRTGRFTRWLEKEVPGPVLWLLDTRP